MARSPGTEPTWVGNTPVRDDLHQQDSEGPYISLDGEHPEVDGLWSSPLDGELGPCQESALASGTAHSPPSSVRRQPQLLRDICTQCENVLLCLVY